MTLRLKLSLSSGALLLVVLGLFFIVNYRIQRNQLREELREQTSLLADQVEAELRAHMLSSRGQDFQDHLAKSLSKKLEEIRVFSPDDGLIIASSIPKEIGKSIYPTDFEVFKRDEQPRVFEHMKNGRSLFSKIVPLYNRPECHSCHRPDRKVIGVLDVEVAADERLAPKMTELALTTAVSFAVIMVSIMMGLHLITHHLVSRPLHDITSTMRRAQAGDLSIRYRTDRVDEIGKLARSLNTMLASLESAGVEIERFHQDRIERIQRLADVGELATIITHELKNPLAGISGAVQVIADDLDPDDPRRQIIEEIQFQIARLDRIIRDLRNYAKPPEPQWTQVGMNTVIEQLIGQVNKETESRDILLEQVLAPDLPEIEMDPMMIQQAVLSLAQYALSQMKPGGRLTVKTRKRDADRIEVIIDGSDGTLSTEKGDALFRPSLASIKAGTGLGLASSKGIVEQHRGIISAGPSPAGGIRFTLILPVSQKGAHA